MRKFYLLCTLVLAILHGGTSFAQDFSNKGKEFWFCFPNHIPSGSNGQMSIWITSDLASSGTIVMTNGTFSANWSVPANGITSINIPYNLAHISNAESGIIIQKSLKVSVNAGQPAVVAYAQQYGNARSAATLLLPTAVLGKKYRAASYTYTALSAGGQNSRCQFQIIATKPNTQVKVTPYSNGTAGASFTLNFPNEGDMYQYQATSDVTSSLIESIAGLGGSSCLPIAVFSGSSASTIGTNGCTNPNSYDPLFQQLYPITTWGKNYGFIPFGDYTNGNPYRIMASEDNTVVNMNGSFLTILNAGDIYPATYNITPVTLTQPTSINADKPICVIEYAQTSACSGTNNGDPDMVILNSIEQNIKDITIFASTQQNINRQWLNVLIPTAYASTFKIDGAIPSTAFQVAFNIPGYSYLRHQFVPAISGSHHLTADTGFNAICYGFQQGNFESYAYSAGTNVIDLTNGVNLESQYGNENNSTCISVPFKFKIYFPDSTLGSPPVAIRFDSLKWDVANRLAISPNNFPVVQIPPVIDSTRIINGRQVNWYSLPGFYTFISTGANTLTITGYRSTNEGCGNEQTYDFPLQIFDPPTGSFTWTTNSGCSTQPVQFNETTPQVPKTTYRFWWNFGDPASGAANISTLRNPTHLFSGPGTYTVSYVGITTPGCVLDTIRHDITVTGPPAANFSVTPPICINVPIQFNDLSTPNGGTITLWDWTFGDGGTSTQQNPVYTYIAGGTYTVTLVVYSNTGCPSAIYSTQIIVGLGGVLTLVSGTANQTVCINNPITTIVYQCSGGITGGNVSGLPPGVTGSFAGGVITILGTPTLAGTYPYTITTTGPCAAPPLGGTIIVNSDATITLTSPAGTDNQTKCINTAIDNIDYSVGGGGTGATINWIPAAPPGINFISLGGGNFRISGIPTAAGTYDYTISTTGPCIIPTAIGKIIVTPNTTVTLRAGDNNNQTVCINTPIATIRYDIGGSGTGGTVSGLPTGVTGSYAANVITILGTPTQSGVFIYTINPTGPCASPIPPVTGTITVNANATIALTSPAGTDNQTKCINTAIDNIDYFVGGGGTGATINWIPAAPPGITFTSLGGGNFRISGIPTAAGTYDYTISTTGPCIIPTATGRLIVTPNTTVTLRAGDNNNQTVCINTPIATIRYDIGGSGTGGTVSGLPTGVTGSYAANVITILGTPTQSGVFIYTINPTGPCASPIPPVTGTITVNANATITLTSPAGTDNQTKCINTAIDNIDYFVGGGGTGASINWIPAAPPGINFISLGGGNFRISGIPTAAGTYDYTISTTGPCIIPTASGRLIVTQAVTVTLRAGDNNNQTVCINTPIATIRYDIGGSGTGGTVSGLPTGVTGSYTANVITILGTPTQSGVFIYTINPTGACAPPVPPVTGTITVNADATITLTSGPGTNNQTKCINTIITDIDYSVGGGGTGASINWIPAAPPGITFTSLGGGNFRISGTPTAAGTYDYTISTTGPCIIPTATGRLIVTPNTTVTLRPGDNNNQTVCINNPIAAIRYDIGGSGTGGTVSGLPTGVTGSYAANVITILGTPTQSGVFVYTINPTGPCASPVPPVTGTITVNADAIITLTSPAGTDNQTKCINTLIDNIDYSVGGGGTGATINWTPAAPPGITFTPLGGGNFQIAGSPTAAGTYDYTISTTGPCILPTASGRLIVTQAVTVTLRAGDNNNQTVCINNPIAAIRYDIGGSGTGGTVSGLPTGVTGSYAANVITILGTPTQSGVFIYTINPTGACAPPVPPVTGTITVNADATITLTSPAGTNNQTRCINTIITDIDYSVGGGGTGAAINWTPAAPPGIAFTSLGGGNFKIAGSPTAAGTYDYTISTTGPCIIPTATGRLIVTADATLSLRPGDNNNQTACINTTIASIRYDIGGTGTGASITLGSLPAGVTGVYNSGVFTISGTATSSGTFNFTVGSSGPCVTPSLTGTLTINPDHAISLSSQPPTTNQTVCSDKLIAAIAYTLSGGATGATVTGLPPGVTYSVSGSVLTIVGAPTTIIGSPFTYFINTTGNSCIRASASGSISVLQTPAVQFNPVAGVCADVPSFQVTANPANGTFSGPGINATGLFNPAAAGSGDHTIRYTFTAANGCSNFKEQILSVFPMPGANAGPDKFMLEGGQVTLTPALNASLPVTYLWAPPQYLSDPTIAYTIASPPVDKIYTLTVTTDKGCSESDQVFIKVLKNVAIPNIFSPNGDGIHDDWVIQFLDTYPGCTVDIFNRYGQRIYHTEGYSKPWDGTINGKPVPIGTYYYIVNPKNGRKIMSGYVDVIR